MKIFIPNEMTSLEQRVAATPESIAQLLKKFPDVEITVASGAGAGAHYKDEDYTAAGAKIGTCKADITLQVCPVTDVKAYEKSSWVVGFMDPLGQPDKLQEAAKAGVNMLAMEKIPRTSRAQSMDALSSQTNIGGYRAVLEATQHFSKFLPLMMTSAGSAKPARVMVLGVGVAGLQAIATARRLGAAVEAFDIRPDTAEQVTSLGAKFIELDVGEEGTAEGGYARELSPAAREKQQAALQEYVQQADIIITTAQVPGRKAPILVTEEAVKGMAEGSVIVDMAAGQGGNCPLTQADKVTTQHGVTLVGYTNYPSMVATSASRFYARNLVNLLALMLIHADGKTSLNINLEDDILDGAIAVMDGKVRG